MYRRIESKPNKIMASESTPKDNCKCSCNLGNPKGDTEKPELNQAASYSAVYYDVTGKAPQTDK